MRNHILVMEDKYGQWLITTLEQAKHHVALAKVLPDDCKWVVYTCEKLADL